VSEPAQRLDDNIAIGVRLVTGGKDPAFAFAVHSWMQDSKGRIPYSLVETADYWGNGDAALDHHSLVEHALGNPRTITLLAHVDGEPDLFVGWLCFEPGANAVHYAYVKAVMRRQRVFARLLALATERGMDLRSVRFTSLPDREMTAKWKASGWRYTPHLLWGLR
jgi:hypothetical protein